MNLQQIEAFTADGYIVLDNWIKPSDLGSLQIEFDRLLNDGYFKKAQIAGASSLKNTFVRGDWTYWLTAKSPKGFQSVFNSLKSWQPELNRNFYCGVTQIEAHLAHYPAGPGYKKHWDQAMGRSERKISFVLYLNLDWQKNDGGELVLYSFNSEKIVEEIVPIGGRLVIFRSELFPHEVRACQQSRRSLTGWFRSDAL